MLELNLKDKTGVNVPSVRVLHSKSNQIKTQADSPVITNQPFTVKWVLVLFESSAVDLNLRKIIERGKKISQEIWSMEWTIIILFIVIQLSE